jgi:uncharacterized protein (TIGR02145 family)
MQIVLILNQVNHGSDRRNEFNPSNYRRNTMRTNNITFAAIITLAMALTLNAFAQETGSFTDARDKAKYKTVKIGEQTWMAENLNYNASGSKCYNNKPANCDKYGRLYDWYTAKKTCPSGWHLPSAEEWDKLFRFADGTSIKYIIFRGDTIPETPYKSETAGKYLKSRSGWNNSDGKSGNGEDKFGFSALPGGCGMAGMLFFGDSFRHADNNSSWWSASEENSMRSDSRLMSYSLEDAYYSFQDKPSLLSVRCVRD